MWFHKILVFFFSEKPEEEGLGTIELAALIAGPVCFLCIVVMIVLYVIQQRRTRVPLNQRYIDSEAESNSLLMPSQQTLHEYIDEWSNSGSGSGQYCF